MNFHFSELRSQKVAPVVDRDESGRKIVSFTTSMITIGIELEMIICNLSEHEDHFKLLRRALIPLTSELYPNKPTPCKEPFEVKDDFSISPGPKHLTGRRAEIATPIMTASGAQSYHTTIPKMCSAIVSAVKATTPAGSIEFNPTTALQVHIGVGDGNTYALKDLKRICKAIVIFESQMDMLHPSCRNPPDGAKPNFLRRCCSSFRLKLLSDAKRLEVIDRQTNMQGLVMVINSSVNMGELPKYYKYNFRSLAKFGTIEFRQAIGTVRGEVVVQWVEKVVRFVTAAVETEDRMYEEWAKGTTISDGDYGRFGVPLVLVDRDIDAYWGVKGGDCRS